jgi:hypothetical protein
MVTLYILITPIALVPSLLWVAVGIAPIVTLFFYGFFTLGTHMLMDPFETRGGFDTDKFLSSTLLSVQVRLKQAMGCTSSCSSFMTVPRH